MFYGRMRTNPPREHGGQTVRRAGRFPTASHYVSPQINRTIRERAAKPLAHAAREGTGHTLCKRCRMMAEDIPVAWCKQ